MPYAFLCVFAALRQILIFSLKFIQPKARYPVYVYPVHPC